MGSSRIWGYAIMAVVMAAVRYPFMFLLAVVTMPSFFGVLHWLDSYSPETQTGISIHVERVVGERPNLGADGNPHVLVTITNNRTTTLHVKNLVCTLEGPVYAVRQDNDLQPIVLKGAGDYIGVHKVLTLVYGGEEHTLAPGATETRQFGGGHALVGTETGNCDWRTPSEYSDTMHPEITWPTLTAKGEQLRDTGAVNDYDNSVRLL